KLKAYSRKAKLRLNKLNLEKEISINEMVTDKKYPFSNKKYEKLISKKIADYEKQSIDLKELKKNKKIKTFLNSFSIIDPDKMKNIYFNEMQKKDLERFLQKKYSLMNWCQGTGKTFASMAWYKYILNNSNCRNIFIVAPAIAIKMTWKKTLDINKENYIQIKSLSDIEKIKKGQIVLLTFSLLASSKNYISEKIKKYIKKQSQKVALVVDESDYLCSYKTQTTKAILDCFKRVNYKLLATGTPTRNNINELYPQLELLYNNSYNMYCECYTKYRYKKGELIEEENNYYNCPFPAYRGYKLFKQCFSPGKATVFGIKKENQDIYNVDKLKKLISKTIISRSFKDIVGENKHDIITHNVKQNSYERDIYKIVIEKFYEMYHYFNRSDNTRKESMLKIIRQLQLLIKAVSIPHLFKEYEDDSVLPNKFKKIIELVNSLNDNQVAIGTTYIDAAKEYYNIFKKTDRPVYFIDGSIPFKKRKSIVNEFTKTRNGIIISTQKSLSCSVNIPTCDNIIIESLQWNIPKISQYYYRFIRLNSEKKKKVHFVTYDNTIEKNILALLLTKEKINDFVKYLEEKKRADVFKEYGIDISIFNSIIEKEIDDEGKIKLNWGKQKIS
ncbi:MAG: SNF2-related protein, partial [archaeon]